MDDYKFERLCEILLYRSPNDEIHIPTHSGIKDGGEDYYSEKTKTKYAFSIQKEWIRKCKDEIKNCIKHNEKQPNSRTR